MVTVVLPMSLASRRVPPSRWAGAALAFAGLLVLVAPGAAAGAGAGATMLGEAVDLRFALSAALVLGGVALASFAKG